MIPTVILLACCLISGLNCSDTRFSFYAGNYISDNNNNNCQRFYNPSSGVLNQYFHDLIRNLRPSLVQKQAQVSTYSLDNMVDSISKANVVTDKDILQYCVDLDASYSSGLLSQEDMKESCSVFWQNTGFFSYVVYNQKTDKWIIFDEDKNDVEKMKESRSKTNADSSRKKKSKKKNKDSDIDLPAPIATFYNPNFGPIREALEHNLCQKAMVISMFVLTPKESAELFRNAPIEILDNPEILLSIDDYSEFKDAESVGKLVQLFSIGTHYAIQHQLSSSLVKTLPLEALHKVIEARNFDLSRDEVKLLVEHRFMFEFKEPFLSDHRTFRLFCAEASLFPFPPSSFIIKDQSLDGKIDTNVIESILAHYVRSEYAIMTQTSNLFNAYNGLSLGELNFTDFETQTLIAINDLINIFKERTRLINFMRQERNIDDIVKEVPLYQVYHRIARILETPLSGLYRHLMSVSIGTLPNYHMGKDWKALFVENLNDNAFITPSYKSLLKILSESIPYDSTHQLSMEELYNRWHSVLSMVTSSHFELGRWNRNFISFLLSNVHPSELVGFSKQFIDDISVCLNIYPGVYEINLPYVDKTLFAEHNWFIAPIRRAMHKKQMQKLDKRFVSDYEFVRTLRRIFIKLDLSNDAVVDAIWKSSMAVAAFNLYPFCMTQDNIDDLMSCDTGIDFMKANPYMLNRLPSYSNFTFNDIELFGLRLDGFLSHAYTFNCAVVKEWLEDQEYIVNSMSRVLLRQSVALFDENPNNWQLLSFESLLYHMDRVEAISKVPDELVDISAAFEHETILADKLSLIARCLIHIETQIAISWFFTNFYAVPGFEPIAHYISGLIKSKRKIIPKLKEMTTDPNLTKDQKKDIKNILNILADIPISTFKAFVGFRENPDKSQAQADYEMIVKNNEFLRELIEKGNGSQKFKSVWRARARLLVLFDSQKNIQPCEDLHELVQRGLLPACDSIFFWFIRNFKNIMRGKIILSTLSMKGEKLEFPKDYTQLPDFELIKAFLFR